MKRSTLRIFAVLAAIGSSSLGWSAPTPACWNLDLAKGSGSVEFNAIGRPSALKIHGKGASPTGTLKVEANELNGAASFALETLDTGISMRNEHMKKKYLEVEKYPEAKITFVKLAVPTSIQKDGAVLEKLPFQGTLSLHGVEKPISGTARVARKSDKIEVAADFGLKVGDYGIAVPKFAGITMAEDVQVSVQLAAPVSVSQ